MKDGTWPKLQLNGLHTFRNYITYAPIFADKISCSFAPLVIIYTRFRNSHILGAAKGFDLWAS
jgi:hypothetical protein